MAVSAPPAAATDYQRDLDRIAAELARLSSEPASADRATRIAHCRYRRASLTGSFDDLDAAEAATDEGIRRFGPWPDLCFLKATIDFELHRLADVKDDVELAPSLRESAKGRALQADLDFQEGRYDIARRAYESLVVDDRTWDALARLAHLEFKLGDDRRADALYAEAVDELTAKELRSYCWVELQRGEVHLSRGRYPEAEGHYERARGAYSGDWLVDEHMAELRAAQGRFDEAVVTYESVVARAPRPELQQALGDLYAFVGEPELARRWHDSALAAYLESVERGQVHYYHHLVDFYADVQIDPAEAVRWARKDLQLRSNFTTQAALARALYRGGQVAEALQAMEAALSSGAEDAHLLSDAATIYLAAGRTHEGEQFLRRAAEINPRLRDFHVHR